MAVASGPGVLKFSSDFWAEPALADRKSTVLVHSGRVKDDLIGLGHPRERFAEGGLVVHESLIGESFFQERIRVLEHRERVKAMVALTGQSSEGNKRAIRTDLDNLADLSRERIRLAFYAGTDGSFAAELVLGLRKRGIKLRENGQGADWQAAVVWDPNKYIAVTRFICELQNAHVIVRDAVETAGLAAVMAHVDLTGGSNPHTWANTAELEDNRLAVTWRERARSGLAACLWDHLELRRGADLVGNMIRARERLRIDGVARLLDHVGDHP